MDSSLKSALSIVGGTDEQYVFVFDNEPRNRFLCKEIEETIHQGFRVCIWPFSMTGKKDINEMIISGQTPESLKQIIEENTFQGPRALLEFNVWHKK